MEKQIKINRNKYSEEVLSRCNAASQYAVIEKNNELFLSRKDGKEPIFEDFIVVLDDITLRVKLESQFYPIRELIVKKAFGQ